MCKTALLCEFTNKIQPETWKIQDLQLEIFNNQEECFENFLVINKYKNRILIVLILSFFFLETTRCYCINNFKIFGMYCSNSI